MLLFALALSLQSCRTGEDYLSAKEEQYYSNKFQVFTSFNDEPIDYAKGFKTLMENYDGIHKTHYTRTSAIKSGNLGKSDEEYVEFRLHSQSMLLEDERWIIYPMVRNGQVSGLMAGILRNEETEVEFRKLDSGNDYYDEVLKIFSIAYLKNKLKSGLNKGSGCGFDSNDACDIGNIDISPPKGGPKGTGPKSGCTGLNNCIKPDVSPGGGESSGGMGGPPTNPCEKTKNLLNKPKVQQGINDVKAQALKTLSDMKAGEIGFKEPKNGGPLVPADVNQAHKVVFNDVIDSYGGYHNHTATGTHMFSPPDIVDALFGFAAAQSAQDGVGNAYLGMIAAEWCNTCPNNAQYIHYVIKYTGTGSELGGYVYTPAQMNQFEKDYRKTVKELTDTNLNGNTYIKNSAGDLNEKGLEKLFFDSLKNMGLDGKVNLQRIEANGTVNNVALNSNGIPVGTPCPN